MSQPGWIKIHRALMDHWSSSEPEALAVWIRMLCEANYEDKKSNVYGQLVEVKRGQLVFGLDAFSARSGVSVKKLRRIIDMLLKDGMLGRQVFNRFSIITITCYDKYQDVGKQEAGEGQAEGKQRAAPKEGNNSRSEEPSLSADADDCNATGKGEESAPLNPSTENCPHKEIIELWHELMPELTTVKTWNEKRAKMLKARWNGKDMDGNKFNNLKFWRKYFEYIRESDWLMGKTGSGWSATLEWVITESNFNKIIEGTYHKC